MITHESGSIPQDAPLLGPKAPGVFQNQNVILTLIYTLLQYIGLSMWQGQLLSVFLYTLSGNSAQTVGYIEGAQGATSSHTHDNTHDNTH